MPGNKLLQRVYMKITSEVGGMAEGVKSIIALEVDNQPRLTSFDFFWGGHSLEKIFISCFLAILNSICVQNSVLVNTSVTTYNGNEILHFQTHQRRLDRTVRTSRCYIIEGGQYMTEITIYMDKMECLLTRS